MDKIEKLPSISGEKLKEAFDLLVKSYVDEHNVLPSKICLYAEGDNPSAIGKYTVIRPLMEIPQIPLKFLK